MADYTLTMNIHGDAESFKRALKAAQDAVDGFNEQTSSLQKKLNRVGDSFQGYGKKLTLGVTTPLALAGKKLVDSASDFEENLNKVDVAFGKNKKEVIAWSNTAIKQFGLSKNQALEATSLFGDMATSMGLTKPAAANMSTSLAGLAGDLASFKNISIDQAMTALKSVFTGETESLKELGIVMTQTNLDAFALANGFGKTIDQMTQAEQVQLRYAYVMEATKNAHGDYARTADGTANSMRTFMGSVDNLAIALGQNLLPAVTPLIHKATDLVNRFAELSPQTQTNIIKFGLLSAALGPVSFAIGTVSKGISGIIGVVGTAKSAWTKFTVAIGNTKIAKDIAAVKDSFNGMTGPLTREQQRIADFAIITKSKLSSISLEFKKMGTAISAQCKALGTSIVTLGKTMQTSLSSGVNAATGHIASFASSMKVGLVSSASSAKMALIGMGSAVKTAIMPFLPAIAIIGALAAAIVYLFNTNEEFRNSMIQSWAEIKAAFEPVLVALREMVTSVVSALAPAIAELGNAFVTLMQALAPLAVLLAETFAGVLVSTVAVIAQLMVSLAPLIAQLMTQLAPVITLIVTTIANLIAQLAPFIAQMISQLVPVISAIVTGLASVIAAIVPIITTITSALMPVIETIISVITTYVIPIITKVMTVVASVITKIIEIVTPIIEFVAGIVAKIIEIVATIIEKAAKIFTKMRQAIEPIWENIKSFISTTIGKIKSVISAIVTPVRNTFNKVKDIVVGVFNKVQGAWSGFKGFVSGVTDGIRGAFDQVVSFFKSLINNVIKGINFAVGIINKIPGVEIGMIPYLAHGTDNWQGGFAYMNEGGRGELVHLPNGSQVIPHDISVKYAKEAARVNHSVTDGDYMDMAEYLSGAILEGLSGVRIQNITNLDGKVIADGIAPMIDKKLGQRSQIQRRGVAWMP